jgi:hypothetical protein
MRIGITCTTVVVLELVTLSCVQAADDAGTRKAEFDTQIGLQRYMYTLKHDRNKVTGKAGSDIGAEKREVGLKEGKQVTA